MLRFIGIFRRCHQWRELISGSRRPAERSGASQAENARNGSQRIRTSREIQIFQIRFEIVLYHDIEIIWSRICWTEPTSYMNNGSSLRWSVAEMKRAGMSLGSSEGVCQAQRIEICSRDRQSKASAALVLSI
jgi:hypothetical protein